MGSLPRVAWIIYVFVEPFSAVTVILTSVVSSAVRAVEEIFILALLSSALAFMDKLAIL